MYLANKIRFAGNCKKLLLALLIFFFFSSPVLASRSAHFAVADSRGNPVSDVLAEAYSSKTPMGSYTLFDSAATDSAGRASLNIPSGYVYFSFSKLGYSTYWPDSTTEGIDFGPETFVVPETAVNSSEDESIPITLDVVPVIWSDKSYYIPGETVTIFGLGFEQESATIRVTSGNSILIDDVSIEDDGTFNYTFQLEQSPDFLAEILEPDAPLFGSLGLLAEYSTGTAGADAMALAASYGAEDPTVTFSPTDDAYVFAWHPDTNYGSEGYLHVRWGDSCSNYQKRSYLKFDISSIPEYAVITGATLSLYRYSGDSTSQTIGAYTVSNSWNEDDITWNNAPTNFNLVDSTDVGDPNGRKEWDVLSAAQDAQSGSGIVNFALKFTSESGYKRQYFYSEECSCTTQRPELIITYILPSCDSYSNSNDCEFNPNCDWCSGCSGNQWSGGGNRCVDAGTCSHSCSEGRCGAECDSESDTSLTGFTCSYGCDPSNTCLYQSQCSTGAYCDEGVRYYNGQCTTTGCQFDTENCNQYDYYEDYEYYCSNGELRQHRLFHDFTCAPEGCDENVYYVDDGLVEDCNGRDGSVSNDCGIEDWTCTENQSSASCTLESTTPDDFLCSNFCNGGVRNYDGICDTNFSCQYQTDDCDTYDYYEGFAEYCSGDSVREHRFFHDFACTPDACTENPYYTDDQQVEDCNTYDGSLFGDCGVQDWTCVGNQSDPNDAFCVVNTTAPDGSYCSENFCSDNTRFHSGVCGDSYLCFYQEENCTSYDGSYCAVEERSYYCSPDSCLYNTTSTETCLPDGWYNYGNQPGPDDPACEQRDYYCLDDALNDRCVYSVLESNDYDTLDGSYCTDETAVEERDYYCTMEGLSSYQVTSGPTSCGTDAWTGGGNSDEFGDDPECIYTDYFCTGAGPTSSCSSSIDYSYDFDYLDNNYTDLCYELQLFNLDYWCDLTTCNETNPDEGCSYGKTLYNTGCELDCGAECEIDADCTDAECNVTYNDSCSGHKLTEYDSDKLLDSTTVYNFTENTCLGSCLCETNTVTCDPPETSSYCVEGVCGAQCDESSDFVVDGLTCYYSCDPTDTCSYQSSANMENYCSGDVWHYNATCSPAGAEFSTYNCSQDDYYENFTYYCDGGSVKKKRLFHDFSCSPTGCTESTYYVDDQPVENCNDRDGEQHNQCGVMDWSCSSGQCVVTEITPNQTACSQNFCTGSTRSYSGYCSETDFNCHYSEEDCGSYTGSVEERSYYCSPDSCLYNTTSTETCLPDGWYNYGNQPGPDDPTCEQRDYFCQDSGLNDYCTYNLTQTNDYDSLDGTYCINSNEGIEQRDYYCGPDGSAAYTPSNQTDCGEENWSGGGNSDEFGPDPSCIYTDYFCTGTNPNAYCSSSQPYSEDFDYLDNPFVCDSYKSWQLDYWCDLSTCNSTNPEEGCNSGAWLYSPACSTACGAECTSESDFTIDNETCYYSCSPDSCTYQYSQPVGNYCSDNIRFYNGACSSAGAAFDQENCTSRNYYNDFEYYCSENDMRKHRLFHQFTCSPDSCHESASYTNDTLVQECVADCGAACSSDSDCAPTQCDSLDGCYGGTYRDYSDEPNTCPTDTCECTQNTCQAYTEIVTDSDGDGYDTECDNDCNDSNPEINPGADEICDGIDNNCNGETDEGCLCLRDGQWGPGHEYLCSQDNTYDRCSEDGYSYEHVNSCSYYCSASPLCDGLAPGTELETCSSFGDDYLQDYCDQNCQLADSTCESGFFGCTADAECDESDPNTGNCTYQCRYKPPVVCGDGKVDDGEECELPNTGNNTYCSQATSTCLGYKMGIRDEYGGCGSSCLCTEDQFTYSCAEGKCNAVCDEVTDFRVADSTCYYSCDLNSTCSFQNSCSTQSYCDGDTRYYSGSCTGAGCTFQTENCSDYDHYEDWEYYCLDGNQKRHRLFHDFSCSPSGCIESTYYTDDELVENCNARDGDTYGDCGLGDWSCSSGQCVVAEIIKNESACSDRCDNGVRKYGGFCNDSFYCEYEEEDCESYDGTYCSGDAVQTRDYSCTPGSCTYTVTSTENCPEDGWSGGGNSDQYGEDPACTYTDYYCAGEAPNSYCGSDQPYSSDFDYLDDQVACSSRQMGEKDYWCDISTCDQSTPSNGCDSGFSWYNLACNPLCGAECAENSDCQSYLADSHCYYSGSCQASCLCSYNIEFCPEPGTIIEDNCYFGDQACTESGCTINVCELEDNEICDPSSGCLSCNDIGTVADSFSDSSSSKEIIFPAGGGSDSSAKVLLPMGINITSATLDITGLPLTMTSEKKVDVILVTDVSSSMYGEKLDSAKAANIEFVNTIMNVTGNTNKIGLVTFESRLDDYLDLTDDEDELLDFIDGYKAGGATCISCGIFKANDMIDAGTNPVRAIIVMSDGAVNRCIGGTTCYSGAQAISQARESWEDYGARVYAISFGDEADNETMQEIADVGHGRHYFADTTNIVDIYREIAIEISSSSATDPYLDSGSNGITEWSYSGEFLNTTETADLASEFNELLANCSCHGCQTTDTSCIIDLELVSSTSGIIRLDNLNVRACSYYSTGGIPCDSCSDCGGGPDCTNYGTWSDWSCGWSDVCDESADCSKSRSVTTYICNNPGTESSYCSQQSSTQTEYDTQLRDTDGVACGAFRDCPLDQCTGSNWTVYPPDGHDYCLAGTCMTYSCEPVSSAYNETCAGPDSDGDGVLNHEDACPDEYGTDCNGCPDPCSGCAVMECPAEGQPTCTASGSQCEGAPCPEDGCGLGGCAADEWADYPKSTPSSCQLDGNTGTCIYGECTPACSYDESCSQNISDHILFTEVFYDTPGSDPQEEWLEIYNPASEAVDISGWEIQDNSASWFVPSGTSIASGEVLTIARNSAGFEALYGFAPDISGLSLSLNNNGDTLTLLNNSQEVDMVSWENHTPEWNIEALTGQSIERYPADSDTDTVTDWRVQQSPAPGAVEMSQQPTIMFNITLYSGWNLFSIPVLPANTTVPEVLKPIEGSYTTLMTYDAGSGSYQIYDPISPVDGITDILPQKGYWIYMTANATLPVNGTVLNETEIQLYPGWNLIGYPSLSARGVDSVLSEISGNFSLVMEFSAETGVWRTYLPVMPGMSDLTVIRPGMGYAVNMMKSDTLTIP
jgi:uncharacterized protein YegL